MRRPQLCLSSESAKAAQTKVYSVWEASTDSCRFYEGQEDARQVVRIWSLETKKEDGAEE